MFMKKLLSLLLVLYFCMIPLTACSQTVDTENKDTANSSAQTENVQNTESTEPAENSDNSEQSEAENGSNTRIIVDQAGNEVEIPTNIERVVISSLWPLPSVYVLFQGSADKLVGMHPASLSAAQNSMLTVIDPEIANVESGFIQNGEINIEELMMLNPDVVFYSATNTEEKELFEKAGIPAVGFSTIIAEYNTVETINSWVDLLGEVFQEEDTAAGITEYGQEVYDEIQRRISTIPEEERTRALILFKYSDTQFQTSGSNFFGQYWCEATGVINVAEELSGMADINMEQVYEWDPDIIYITNFSAYMPEDLYDNTALDGHDWSGVSAVENGNVYKYPLGMYRWYPPSSESALCLWFMAKANYPELFEDIDLEQIVRDYYEEFYDIELTDEQVDGIFNPVEEAADGV